MDPMEQPGGREAAAGTRGAFARFDGGPSEPRSKGPESPPQPAVASVAEAALKSAEHLVAENVQVRAERDQARAALEAVARTLPVAIWLAHDVGCEVVTGNAEAHRQYRMVHESKGPMSQVGAAVSLNFAPSGSACLGWATFLHDGVEVKPEEFPIAIAAREAREVRGYEMDIVFRDGESRTLCIDAAPILDEHGRSTGAVAASLDITQIREREKRLQRSEARFQTLLKSVNALLCITDGELRMTEPLPAWERFTQQPFEQAQGFGWENAIHPADREQVRAAVAEAVKSGAAFKARYRLWQGAPGRPFTPGVEGTGEWRHIDDTSGPVFNAKGELCEWAGMMVDRTEQHFAEEAAAAHARALARSNQDLEEFAHVAAHDLKEPLRGLRLLAKFLEDDLEDRLQDKDRERLKGIQALCGRMQSLMDSLLESARVNSEVLKLEPTTLARPLKEAVSMLAGRIAESGAEVTADGGLGEIGVRCDVARTAQVLSNLIANGLKYNESAVKQVRISASVDAKGWVTVRVADNGIGIPPEQFEAIFRMFRRLHGREGYGGGTGAGLAIARKIVERHGGKMWAESRGRGEGSTFAFTLPGA